MPTASAAPTATPGAAKAPADVPGRVPAIAERAYRLAAAASGTCRLDWSVLAGIGKVETDHGRVFGGALAVGGSATPAIVGPPTEFGPASGPMQILASTWATWKTDGNHDGSDDVQNVYDASAGAARYLCAADSDLSGLAAQQVAVFSYNHVDAYVFDVLAYAAAYAAGTPDYDVVTVPILDTPTAPPSPTATPGVPGTTAPATPRAPAAPSRPASSSAAPTATPSPTGRTSSSPTTSPSPSASGTTAVTPTVSAAATASS